MNQNIPPMPNIGGNGTPPPPPHHPNQPNPSGYEPPQTTDKIEFTDAPIEDIFQGYDNEELSNTGGMGETQGGYEPQSQPQSPSQGSYETPKMVMNPNILTVAGLIGLIIVMSFVFKVGKTKFNSFRDKREYNIKMNSSNKGAFIDNTNTPIDIGRVEYNDDSVSKDKVEDKMVGQVVTQVARYEKDLSEDNRTILKLGIDGYGDFDIYISKYQYDTLDDKGYLIVDMEMINKKVNYVFISNKQENFKDILDGK